MNHTNWKPAWIRGGKLEEIVWIGNDVLAWCLGVHIVFFNVVKKKQWFYWCWNHDTGEGAKCLSSHSKLPVFAFTERLIQPRILIVAYPSMTKIAECSGGCPSGFLATAFTEGDHIISVGSFPYFRMTVWNWRTGDKIISVDSFIRDEVGQILRITQIGPIVVAQLGKTCGKLYTWEVEVFGKVAILTHHEVKLPKESPILWVDWCPTSKEPLLAITDIYGHVYLSNNDGSNVYLIVLSQRCGICLEIEAPLVGWFRDGIILRTTFCQIRFFKRNPRMDMWKKEWLLKSETRPYILMIHPSNNVRFFYLTFEGFLMQLEYPEDNATPKIEKFHNLGCLYKFVDFVYPWCHHLVVTCQSKELMILESYEGSTVATLDIDIDNEITCQASHPDFPFVCFGTTKGEVVVVSLIQPEEPKVLAKLRLQRSSVDLLKFSYPGRFVVAAEKETGNCYCISLQRDRMFTVQTLMKVGRSITDLLIYEGHRKLRILVLYVSAKQYSEGQQLQLFEISNEENLVTQFIHVLTLAGAYRSLWHVPGNPTSLIGTPYVSRQLRVQKLQDFSTIILEDAMVTGHLVKLATLYVDRSWITTVALDGLVVVRDKSVRKVIATLMTHHRSDLGSVKAVATRHGDLIVCLGKNGTLVATKTVGGEKKEQPASPTSAESHWLFKMESDLYERHKKKIASDYASLDPVIYDILKRPKYEFPDPEEHGDKTWFEWREEEQIKEEEEKCREEKIAILKDFDVLRGKVKKLLDANEVSPEIERLPVAAFDLDLNGRDQKVKAGRDVCEDLRLELEHNISEMQRVSRWIRENFWKPQKILGKCLFAIFDNTQVTNYPSFVEDPYTKDHIQWAKFCKDTAYGIVVEDTFKPWQLYSEEELQVEVNKKMKLFREEDKRIDLLLDDDEEEKEVDEEEMEMQREMEGTTTEYFIEPSAYYPQLGYYGFSQVMVNSQLLLHDCEKLRAYFNQSFDEVYALKEREMNVIRERIERIRYIDSELNTMFGGHVPSVPTDPVWHWQERPESIIKVQDHEVKAKPYISPSQQELLDMQAAEEERIRLLLLADDFRERALMAMMDGVLEVRWEDTIKIDVPKPACMLEKKPDDYTAEDILTVKQYEKDVQFLQEERERYKRMLEAEYWKVMSLLQEGIDKFNGKVNDLFRLKIKIDSAINQLYLRYIRGWMLIHRRMKSLREEDDLKKRITEEEEYETVLHGHIETFRNILKEQALKYISIANKEKAVGRKFKSEFSALHKLHVEVLERQYNRRPRTNLKNLQASEYYDLAYHVLHHTTPIYLPNECKEYLRALHHLDVRRQNLPVIIEGPNWEQLVRLRRQRIDAELRMKGKQAEIMDVEDLIVGFEQKIEKCKADVGRMKKDLIEMRKRQVIEELDVEIQLVLKMGQVEIDFMGDVNDTVDAVLVSQTEIEAVNKLIKAAGECKLEALSRLLSFQRGTLLKEWQHECQKKKLEDLEEDLRFTESVTVSKEMQRYLTRKARGLPDDKTPQQLNDDIEANRKRFEKLVEGHRGRFQAIQKEIEAFRSRNDELDKQIVEMNVARCEMEQRRDLIGEERQREHAERKLWMVMRRSELIKKLQDNYAELIELQTEHELLRLKRYPTFNFRMLDDEAKGDKKDDSPRRMCPC
ncbi:Cilia- and flagella-associated protein 43 [Anthophora quadrimaculata]